MNYTKYLVLVVIFITLNCSKKSDMMVEKVEQYYDNHEYTKLINLVADSLRKNPELDKEIKLKIYPKYSVSIAMKTEGAIHYTLLDSLKKYNIDSEYEILKKEKIGQAEAKKEAGLKEAAKGDVRKAINELTKANLIFPSNRRIQFLIDSLEKVKEN